MLFRSKKIKYRVKGAKKKYGKLLFRTSNKKIATVSKKGKIKAKKKGKVTITAYFRNRKRIKKSVRITVGKKVSEIKLTKIDNSRIFEPNESSKISAKVYPSDAGNKRLKWVSSNNAIAKVDSKGSATKKPMTTKTSVFVILRLHSEFHFIIQSSSGIG